MGVIGSHCQLCRVPLNLDNYAAEPGGHMLRIVRTENPGEHAWLCDAVAIARYDGDEPVLRGTVQDGSLTDRESGDDAFIWEGDEDALAFHHWCWQRMGEPANEHAAVRGEGLHAWSIVDAYRGQLFEHAAFREHGHAWMLEDPERSQRNRDRIDAMLARARARPAPQEQPHASVRELVAADRGWRGMMTNGHVVHYRSDLHPGLDTQAYPALVWAMKEYGSPGLPSPEMVQALLAYEVTLIAAAETNGAAICLMTTLGDGQAQYLLQARDEAATRALLEALPAPDGTKPIDFDNESDPTWKTFFEQMNPRRDEA